MRKNLAKKLLALAGVLVLLVCALAACKEEPAAVTTTVPQVTEAAPVELELYWNLDRAEFDGKSEAGMSSRMPESDGYFHVRMFKDGQVLDLKVSDRRVVNHLDTMSLMGVEFDEEGIVVDVMPVEDMPLEKVGWQFYVQSFGGKMLKVNSANTLKGMEVLLELNEDSRIYDMTGAEGEVGSEVEPIPGDRVYPVADLEGNIKYVFIYKRDSYMQTHEAFCQHCQKEVTWKEWVMTEKMPLESGHFQLQNDITLKSQASMPEDCKMCLDLNGKTIDGKEGQRVVSMHNAGDELAVMDTSEGQKGAIRSHGELAGQGGVMYVRFGAFYLYGGTLDGSDAVNTYAGALMCINKGAYAYINGGTIKGGVAKYSLDANGKPGNGMGGNIRVLGKLVINDGLIEGGKALAHVTWKNGKASYARGYGGNIYMGTGGTLEMNGGKVANGVAGNAGGNIYIDGTCDMTFNGGVIGGGRLTAHDRNGGNLYVGSKATLVMNGGIIRNGVVYNGGANVYANGKVTISAGQIYGGKVLDYETGKEKNAIHNNLYVVNGNLRIYGGKISGGVTVSDTSTTDNKKAYLTLSGNPIIYGAAEGRSNLTLSSSGEKVLIYVGTLGKNAKIGISTARGVFTQPRDEAEMEHFVSDIPGAEVVYFDGAYALGRVGCLCGQETHLAGCDGQELLWSPWTSETNLPNVTGNYYLTKPVTVTNQTAVKENEAVALDLNGNTVTAENVYRVYASYYEGASLTITDSQQTGVIRLVGQEVDLGGIVLVRSGASFTLMGGTLDASESVCINGNGGGAVFTNTNGTFTMHGGTIKGATNTVGGGGAITVAKGGHMILTGGTVEGGKAEAAKGGNINVLGTLDMTGGEVKGGKAQYGGNIYVEGKMTLSGGSVTGGVGNTRNILVINGELILTGGQMDGGVTIDDRTAGDGVQTILRISGSPVITGASQNLNLSDRGDPITVYVGKMELGAQVGVTAPGGVFTMPCEAGNEAYFTGDKTGVDVVYYDGALALGKVSCLCGKAEHLSGCDQAEHFWMPWTGENLPTTTGYWYLTGDVTMKAASEVRDAQQVVLDLNGCKVTGDVLRLYSAAASGVSITITDTVDGGVMQNTRQNGDLGGIVLVRSDASFTLINGILDASAAKCVNKNGGGAVFVNTNGTFTMYGGTVKGAESTGNGGAISIAKGGSMTLKGGTVEGGKVEAGKGGAINVLGELTMEGGEVKGGKAQYGGNIYVEGKMTLSGGSVTGGAGNTRNILVLNGELVLSGGEADGGVTIDDRTAGDGVQATIRISGKPVITGVSQNLNLSSRGDGAAVYVGEMEEGAAIGITGQAGIFSQPCDADSAKYFTADDKTLAVGYYDGALALGKSGCICGKETHVGACDGKAVFWMPWTGENLPKTTGYWYLPAGITLGMCTNIPADQKVVLDLNGQTVIVENSRAYSVDTTGADLVITDRSAKANGTLKITGTDSASGLCVYVRNGNFTLYGGHLDASAANSTHTGQGGIAVWVNKSRTFTMYDGTVKGNMTACMNGGTIEVSSGGFMELHGGTVYGAETTKALNGTAINVSGTLKIFGGTVEGGSTAGLGGSICVKGVMEMSGGTVTGGTTTGNGGNIYISDTGSLTMTGGLVEKGDGKYGKNIFVDGNMTMEGGTVQTGNILVLDGTMTLTGGKVLGGLSVDDRSATDSVDTLLTISGTPEVAGMTLVDRGATCKLRIGNLTVAKPIPISAPVGIFATVESGVDAGSAAACFVSKDAAMRVSRQADGLHMVDSSAVIHCLCGQSIHTPGCDGNEVLWTVWAKTNTTLPTTTGYWYLEDDMTLTGGVSLAADQKIVLDLNGKTATMSNNRLYSVHSTGSSLVVTDSSAAGSGTLKVTGSSGNSGLGIYVRSGDATWIRGILDVSEAKTTHTSQGGTAIWINNGRTFTMYGGTILGGIPTKSNNGGTIEVSSGGAMEMYGGTVVGCNAPDNSINGTAINNTGSFKMYGGTVQGGTTKGVGGAICARGITEIHGGIITDGTSGNGKSIYANGSGDVKLMGGQIGDVNIAGKISISGAPQIGKLTVPADKLTVGALTDGASITVAGSGVVAKNVETDVSAYFKAVDAAQKVVYNADEKTLTVQ